jgi:hypothetical protein
MKQRRATILDNLDPSFNSRFALTFQLFFESPHLLADICCTAHVKAIGNPALTHRGRTGYRPCETHLPGFATFTYSELVFAQLKRLGVPGEFKSLGQFEGIGCERVTKKSEEILLIR